MGPRGLLILGAVAVVATLLRRRKTAVATPWGVVQAAPGEKVYATSVGPVVAPVGATREDVERAVSTWGIANPLQMQNAALAFDPDRWMDALP